MLQSVIVEGKKFTVTKANIQITDKVYNSKDNSWGYAMKMYKEHVLIIHEDYTESLVPISNVFVLA